MARVALLSVAPVKGMALLHPRGSHLTARGLPDNRRFYLIDEQDELFSSFDHGPLVSIVTGYDPDAQTLSMRFPDGSEVRGRALGHGPAVVTDFHGRPVGGRLVHGPWNDAVSAFAGRPLRLVRTDRDGEGADVEPVTIVSSASVRELATRGGYGGELDPRRFRIDIQLDGCEAFEEDTWEGSFLRIGQAGVRVFGQIPRCRVTTQSPTTGIRDWNTLTQIARFRPRIAGDGGIPFGMYARVERPGPIRVGDPVAVG